MSEKKLHIAIISTWYPSLANATGLFVRDQADALIDAGNKVTVFMFQYYSLIAWLKKKLKGEPLSNWTKGKNFTPFAGNFVHFYPTRFSSNPIALQKKTFLKYVETSFASYISRNGKPDVIHHHGIANYCYITAHLSKVFNIPYVITEHSMFIDKIDHFNSYETKEERLEMIQKAAARITVSNFYKEFNEELFHVPFIMIPNMINNDFSNTPLPVFPKNTKPFLFLNIGELARRKRQDILIEAFTMTFKGNTDVRLTIIGKGKLEDELKNLVVSLNMHEQIQFAGHRNQDELIRIIDSSHVVVISSEKESFSMVAAEALFRGNPVLTTRCKGPEDFINEINGMICELNSIDDMQQKLFHIYNIYSSFNPLQISHNIKNQFSEAVIVAKLEALYRKVISLSSLLPGKNNGNQ
ncbi:MAG TPA: glycosyltransferase family 4 protein [Bacteroidia bacterium]|jgi:glycosyltransferase involved in cell wall biosynthesis|nr:glycosyltransferase family 4 protein [Bacteroidia bacterium]